MATRPGGVSMEGVRTYTHPEAEELLPMVEPIVERAQGVAAEVRRCEANLRDLLTVYGDAVKEPGHEAHEELKDFVHAREDNLERLREAALELDELGIELKDPEIGLIDFYSEVGDEIVFLCWKLGEDRIRYWHTLEGGFAGRQPLPDIDLMEP